MIIHAISDTHSFHDQFALPGGDIVIHAGDLCGRSTLADALKFLEWFKDLPYTHKILVPGNHDGPFEDYASLMVETCKDFGITLLNDSGTEINGIKIWGSPITPFFNNWYFNRHPGPDIKKHWDLIPEDTEILITHGPPHGILDFIPYQNKSVGCPSLLNRVLETQVKLHIFGHIHCGRGFIYQNSKTFVNVAALDEQYQVTTGNPRVIVKNTDGEYVVQEE